MIKLSKKVLAGAVAATLLTSGTAFAWNFTPVTKDIKARFAHIKLAVNGRWIQTNAEPFIYNGNVYAPVATIANALGVHQQWDNRVPSVEINGGEGFYEGWMVGHPDEHTVSRLDYYNGIQNVGDQEHPSYQVVNADIPNFKPIPIPQIPHEGYYYRQEKLTELIHWGTEVADSFIMGEVLQDKKTGEQQYWVSVYRYHPDKDVIYKLFSQRLDEGEAFTKEVSYANDQFTMKLKSGSQTVGVKWFRYDFYNKKVVKVDEVMK
jgi:hypothetical protein